MGITLYKTVNRPLKIEELDGNFEFLAGQIDEIGKSIAISMSEQIGSVKYHDGFIYFIGTKNSEIGKVEMPVSTLNARGSWAEKENYSTNDIVQFKGSVFICVKQHISKNIFEEIYWKMIIEVPKVSHQLNCYNLNDLPAKEMVGAMAILVIDSTAIPIYFDGKEWKYLSTNEIINMKQQ